MNEYGHYIRADPFVFRPLVATHPNTKYEEEFLREVAVLSHAGFNISLVAFAKLLPELVGLSNYADLMSLDIIRLAAVCYGEASISITGHSALPRRLWPHVIPRKVDGYSFHRMACSKVPDCYPGYAGTTCQTSHYHWSCT